jgi:hypothetical protein
MFTANVRKKFHSLLVTAFIQKTTENFRTATMLCFTLPTQRTPPPPPPIGFILSEALLLHSGILRDGSVAPTSQICAPAMLLLLSEESVRLAYNAMTFKPHFVNTDQMVLS